MSNLLRQIWYVFADRGLEKLSFQEKTNSTREHYNQQSEKEQRLREELRENEREVTNIVCRLKNIDLTRTDLKDVIENLREGIEYLGKVKQHWQQLVYFFDNIHIIVHTQLSNNINDFVESVQVFKYIFNFLNRFTGKRSAQNHVARRSQSYWLLYPNL